MEIFNFDFDWFKYDTESISFIVSEDGTPVVLTGYLAALTMIEDGNSSNKFVFTTSDILSITAAEGKVTIQPTASTLANAAPARYKYDLWAYLADGSSAIPIAKGVITVPEIQSTIVTA